jgi:hypothetical protein
MYVLEETERCFVLCIVAARLSITEKGAKEGNDGNIMDKLFGVTHI